MLSGGRNVPGSPAKIISHISRVRLPRLVGRELRITRVFRCVARALRTRATFMFAGGRWWRLLVVDGGSAPSRGRAVYCVGQVPNGVVGNAVTGCTPTPGRRKRVTGQWRLSCGLMGRELDGMLSPNPHYYEIRGRAAEMARALGSRAGGAEHLFLGMLHDGGWPVSVIVDLVDLGQAEVAVFGILNSPGYSPPPPPRFPARAGGVQMWGAQVALEMGDSYLGAEHAFSRGIAR
jgi:Clp amino terminal domain, pathogenicity island component